MFRKQALFLAAFTAAGAALLSACSGGATDGSAAPSTPAGSAVDAGFLNLLSGTARSNHAPQNTGDFAPSDASQQVRTKWISLRAAKVGDLSPVLVNGKGLTVYRFDKDSSNPAKSTCNGDCAKKWPPILVGKGTKVFVAGVKKSAIGYVTRDDGTRQLTVNGWSAYTFSGDHKPGDTNGEGVGGTWFGLSPTGGKVLPSSSSDSAGSAGSSDSSGSGSDAKAATSTVLFDDAYFSDNGASQGLALGAGDNACQNVARPGVTSSLTTDGTLKLWTGKNCTGKSTVVSGDVRDLSSLGFDDTVESVHFGA